MALCFSCRLHLQDRTLGPTRFAKAPSTPIFHPQCSLYAKVDLQSPAIPPVHYQVPGFVLQTILNFKLQGTSLGHLGMQGVVQEQRLQRAPTLEGDDPAWRTIAQ